MFEKAKYVHIAVDPETKIMIDRVKPKGVTYGAFIRYLLKLYHKAPEETKL
ncbi:MAG: hypothetical protein QXO33_05865 [Nitrososphaeria archaeon]